eukprot:765019-Hanusia_phi.AAC.6
MRQRSKGRVGQMQSNRSNGRRTTNSTSCTYSTTDVSSRVQQRKRLFFLESMALQLFGIYFAYVLGNEVPGTSASIMQKEISSEISSLTCDIKQDLWAEYHNIFRFGNRNAASHLWATFLLERSSQMTMKQLEYMFSGFCAVSGSPVRPSDYNRYMLNLGTVLGGSRIGYMHFCCWPCVCDTQDFIRVDTKNVLTSEGVKQYHFAVIGNPCDHPEKLNEPFVQPFGYRETTLSFEAREIRCVDGKLAGATLSDHGYPIIAMFFDLPGQNPSVEGQARNMSANALLKAVESPSRRVAPQPGRVLQVSGVYVQDEYEWKEYCSQRAAAGYNSGMGEIFRKVAAISPILKESWEANAIGS